MSPLPRLPRRRSAVTNGAVVDSGLVDLPAAAGVLTAGGALVVPNPAPLTCVIAASSPEVVNRAKRRRIDRPVALVRRSGARQVQRPPRPDSPPAQLGVRRAGSRAGDHAAPGPRRRRAARPGSGPRRATAGRWSSGRAGRRCYQLCGPSLCSTSAVQIAPAASRRPHLQRPRTACPTSPSSTCPPSRQDPAPPRPPCEWGATARLSCIGPERGPGIPQRQGLPGLACRALPPTLTLVTSGDRRSRRSGTIAAVSSVASR